MINQLLHNGVFWVGVLCAPLFYYVVLRTLWWVFIKQRRAIIDWYWGLPFIQYPSMWLVVMGCRRLKDGKLCQFMTYEGRFWISPSVQGFKIPEEKQS